LVAQGQFAEAAAMYRAALGLQPLLPEAHHGLGTALRYLGNFSEAETHCIRALEMNPDHWSARISLGYALLEQGRLSDAMAQVALLSPARSHPGFPHRAYGILLARAGCPEDAKASLEQHLKRNPYDKDGVELLLASLGGALPARASESVLVGMYASRANHWDRGAAGPTGYQGARLVAAAMLDLTAEAAGLDVIDAGCGTGLVGELLLGKARSLIGVDLSAPMLEQARRKKLYTELHKQDLVAFLNSRPASCDVIASAATLIHFGELDAVFAAAAGSLRPRGLMIFTVFPNEESPDEVAAEKLDGYGQGGCFRHGQLYLRRKAAQFGFDVEQMQLAEHEYVRKQPKLGLVVALRLVSSGPTQPLAA
jgi:predicted TPR repeat methyltransferase